MPNQPTRWWRLVALLLFITALLLAPLASQGDDNAHPPYPDADGGKHNGGAFTARLVSCGVGGATPYACSNAIDIWGSPFGGTPSHVGVEIVAGTEAPADCVTGLDLMVSNDGTTFNGPILTGITSAGTNDKVTANPLAWRWFKLVPTAPTCSAYTLVFRAYVAR